MDWNVGYRPNSFLIWNWDKALSHPTLMWALRSWPIGFFFLWMPFSLISSIPQRTEILKRGQEWMLFPSLPPWLNLLNRKNMETYIRKFLVIKFVGMYTYTKINELPQCAIIHINSWFQNDLFPECWFEFFVGNLFSPYNNPA